MGFREEECWDDSAGAEGFSSRANIVEAGHASFLRAMGGRKMQLDITAAVLVTGAGMLLQMSDAKARREALTKPAGGPTLADNQRRQEEWQRRVQQTREELRSGGSVREGEREFSRRVEEAGYVTDPVGTDRIESRTKRRRDTMDTGRREPAQEEGDDEEGTHRADTVRTEVRKKRGRSSATERDMEDVGGSGVHKDVREAVGDLTERDLMEQAKEYERLEEEMHAKSKGGSIWDEDIPMNERDIPMAERDELCRLREELDAGEAELKRKRQREGDERSEDEAGDGEGESGGDRGEEAQERSQSEEQLEQRVPDSYRPDARKINTDWGLARLKGNDFAICCGSRSKSYGSFGCIEPLNAGVKGGHFGNVVLMK